MKRFIDTIRNIFRIEELRKRIVYTILLLLVFRFGSFVVIPGVDPTVLDTLRGSGGDATGLLGLLDIFSGGAFSNASIFALGVMPYISASIVMQLLGMVIPAFAKMQKEGESGRKKMNQYTRLLTIVVLFLQGPAYISTQIPQEALVIGGTLFSVIAMTSLIAGTMFVMWLGERITDKGLGNGVSLLIMIGIVARLPHAFLAEISARFAVGAGGPIMLIVEVVILYLIFMATIALLQATRQIPVQYAKRIVGNKQYGGVRQYLPLKLNSANVMPIIFAQALMYIPMNFSNWEWSRGFAAAFTYGTFWYNFVFALLVIAFTYFYTAIIINPNMMADELKRNGGYIPGVKPGKETARYIDSIMTRITLPGSIFLALVAILPVFAGNLLGVSQQFAMFFGGTSLLILVGVVLDTLKQVESHLLSRRYDGLMKTGRIKGRAGY